MGSILSVAADNGERVFFEVDEVPSAGPEVVSRHGHLIAELDKRLTDALATVRPATQAIVRVLDELNPEELIVEFGLKLDADLGAIIAKTGVSGHFTVTLKLRRPVPSTGPTATT